MQSDELNTPTIPTRQEFLTPVLGALNVLHVVATHVLLIGWFWVTWNVLPLVLYLPTSILACLIHQRAMSEWLHEGAHYNLVRNQRINDPLTNMLACLWIGLTVVSYRGTHFPHHATEAFFVDGDPDTGFLKVTTRAELIRAVLRDITGMAALRQYARFRAKTQALEGQGGWFSLLVVFQLTLLTALWTLGRLDAYVLYYGTLVTLYPLLNRIRVYGQHVTIEPNGRSTFPNSSCSRTIDAGIIDRILCTSPLMLYHNEHHRWPHLPYRALETLCVPSSDFNRYGRSRWAVLRAIYAGLA